MVGVVVEKRLLVKEEVKKWNVPSVVVYPKALAPHPPRPSTIQGSPTASPANNHCINTRSYILLDAVFLGPAADLCIWTHVLIKTFNQIHSPASDPSMMLILPILFYVCFLAVPAIANVEKTIFTAPNTVNLGDARPNLMDLRLDILSSKKLSIRTVLPVIFPTETQSRGLSSWYTLDGLRPGQRYEVRICWAATVSSNSLAH